MSAEEAARIEQASWSTTQRLVDAFEDDEEATEQAISAAPAPVEISQEVEPLQAEAAASTEDTLDPELLAFLRLAYSGDAAAQKNYCRSIGRMPETLADAINEHAVELWGDILLEDGGDGTFTVIEDYQEQAQALLL